MIIEVLNRLLTGDPTVSAYVEDRVYPVTMPDAPTYPLIVLTKVAGPPQYDLQGPANLEGSRIQVDVHTDLGAENCIAVKSAVKHLLSGFRGSVDSGVPCQIQGSFCINDFDLTQPTTERAGPRVRRRTLEFMIWSREI